MMSMKIEGAAEFSKALRQLSPRAERGLQNKMLLQAAEPIRARASELAPVDEAHPPHLRDHILAKATSAQEIQDVNLMGKRLREESEAIVVVGPIKRFFYAWMQEFGTENHPAHPFMRPAFDEAAPRAVGIYAAEMWKWMRSKANRVSSTMGRYL